MRGKISDQDLTNYALNDGMEGRERLYVESMLAVSEPCRNDIYNMIELGQMLEEGFEHESDAMVPCLTAAQREELLRPQTDRGAAVLAFVNRAVATLAVAACVAFALVNTHNWNAPSGSGSKVVQVGTQMSDLGMRAVAATEDFDFSTFVDFQMLSEDSSDWLQAASDAAEAVMQPATICTPPSLLEAPDFSDIH